MSSLTGLTAYLHVADVERSLAFYARLGLEPRNRHEEDGRLIWAFLAASPDADRALARVMLAQADAPIDPHAQGVLLYGWTQDVAGLQTQLRAAGVETGEIERPFYMPAGELQVVDPDGYVLLIGQLGTG